MIVCKMINGVQIVKNKQSFLKTNIKISPHHSPGQGTAFLAACLSTIRTSALVSHSTALSRLDSNMIQTFKGGVEASLRNKLSSRLYRTPVQIGETRHSVAATGGAGGGERGAGRSGAAAAGVPRTGPGAVSSHQAVVTVERRALDTATHLDITRHLDMSAHVTRGAW